MFPSGIAWTREEIDEIAGAAPGVAVSRYEARRWAAIDGHRDCLAGLDSADEIACLLTKLAQSYVHPPNVAQVLLVRES